MHTPMNKPSHEKYEGVGKSSLLCMPSLVDCPFEIFEGSLVGRYGKEEFGSLLLNHSNVVENDFVAWLEMEGLFRIIY